MNTNEIILTVPDIGQIFHHHLTEIKQSPLAEKIISEIKEEHMFPFKNR